MKLKNYSDRVLKEAGIGIEVEPGATVEVEDGYCRPLRAPNGARIPSIIERVCPGLEPADEKFREEWKTAAEVEWLTKPPPPSAEEIQAKDGVSPGVAAIMAEKAKAEAAEKVKAEAKKTLPFKKPGKAKKSKK